MNCVDSPIGGKLFQVKKERLKVLCSHWQALCRTIRRCGQGSIEINNAINNVKHLNTCHPPWQQVNELEDVNKTVEPRQKGIRFHFSSHKLGAPFDGQCGLANFCTLANSQKTGYPNDFNRHTKKDQNIENINGLNFDEDLVFVQWF